MELVDAGRVLWSRKWLLIPALLLSVLAGVAVCYKVSPGLPPKLVSRYHEVGQAAAQVLIDTPKSQIADVASGSADPNLYAQASLLADTMATAPVQQAIAAAAGIPAGALAVTPPEGSVAVPVRATPLAVAGQAAVEPAGTWKLTISVDPSLPIIAFYAVAPDQQSAGRLVADAVAALGKQMQSNAVTERIPPTKRLVVNPIDPPTSAPLGTGPRKLYGVVVALFLFLFLSFVIVMTSGASRRRRKQKAAERRELALRPDQARGQPTAGGVPAHKLSLGLLATGSSTISSPGGRSSGQALPIRQSRRPDASGPASPDEAGETESSSSTLSLGGIAAPEQNGAGH